MILDSVAWTRRPSSMDSALLEDYQEDETSPRTFGGRLVGLASGLGEALARTAASASMLLADGHLRKQGAKALSEGASRGLKGVTTGVSAGVQTLQAGPKHLRAALVRIQKRIEEERLAGLVKARLRAGGGRGVWHGCCSWSTGTCGS